MCVGLGVGEHAAGLHEQSTTSKWQYDKNSLKSLWLQSCYNTSRPMRTWFPNRVEIFHQIPPSQPVKAVTHFLDSLLETLMQIHMHAEHGIAFNSVTILPQAYLFAACSKPSRPSTPSGCYIYCSDKCLVTIALRAGGLAPTISSATSPSLITLNVGIAVTPSSCARSGTSSTSNLAK